MRFEVKFPATRISNGMLVYRADEYSFDVEPQQKTFTSVLFNDLNLEISEQGYVTSVWGLCPYTSWNAQIIAPPVANFGDLLFISDRPLLAGVSIQPDDKRWPVYFDYNSGWVFLNRGRKADIVLKLLTGIVIAIDHGGELAGIWLKPDVLPSQLLI